MDFAIHLPHRHGDERNIHAHVLTTTRAVTAAGLGAKTAMESSNTDLAKCIMIAHGQSCDFQR